MKGLILAGGDSSRLGTDKAFLKIHAESQVHYLFNQFGKLSLDTWVSIPEKKKSLFTEFPVIYDKSEIQGPLSGIAAAFETYPGPWVVFAVDMPFVDSEVFHFLIKKRKNDIATCLSADRKYPEPLACVWEPGAGKLLTEFIKNGGESPSQFLLENNAELVPVPEADWLLSINTPDDLEFARKKLAMK